MFWLVVVCTTLPLSEATFRVVSSSSFFLDHYSIKASTKKRPTLVNRDKTPIVEEDGILYGGCYVNVSIDLWVMDNAYGKKVLASLNAIQFVKDGEAFGTKSEGADCFESLDDDDDFLS